MRPMKPGRAPSFVRSGATPARPSRWSSLRRGLLTGLAAGLVAASMGCGGLTVKRINAAEKKPNNVWVFFTVQDGKEPVGGLAAEDFKIYEDGSLVSTLESKQTIQNPEVAAVMYTMLLVDMSGSVTESGQVGTLVDSAKSFAEKVGKSQKVGVYSFDGSPKIEKVVGFTDAAGSVDAALERMKTYKPKDPSTNLHGAVVEALKELKKELDKDSKPLKFGTLVVFSDGTDRAARLTRKEMTEEIDKPEYENYELLAIGVGAEIAKAKLDDIGRNGTELVQDQTKVKEAFDKVAARIDAHMKRFYLLSYCTPARKGEHRVKIEAVRKNPEASGSLEYTFKADGFGPPPECDPKAPPSFSLKASEQGDKGEASGGAKVEVKAGAGKK
jgi:hypothetical protein